MNAFWVEGQLRSFPHNVFSDRSRSALPSADLYGAGMSMALYARWGEPRLAEATVSQVRERLGPWPSLRRNTREDAGAFAAGPAADALWGLAQMRSVAGVQ